MEHIYTVDCEAGVLEPIIFAFKYVKIFYYIAIYVVHSYDMRELGAYIPGHVFNGLFSISEYHNHTIHV